MPVDVLSCRQPVYQMCTASMRVLTQWKNHTPGLSALNLTTKLLVGRTMRVSRRIGVAGNAEWLLGS